MKIRICILFLSLSLLIPGFFSQVNAKTMSPGDTWVRAGFGLGAKLGSQIGGSNYFLMLNAGAEHSFDSNFSFVGDVDWGVAGTLPLRIHAGGRYRLTGLELPLSPFAQLQLSGGMVFNALGADLGLAGLRAGLGTDYFITSKLSGGAVLNFDFNTTLGERPAFYGQWEFLLSANYKF